MLIKIPFIYEASIKTMDGDTTTVAVVDSLDVEFKDYKSEDFNLTLSDSGHRYYSNEDMLLTEFAFLDQVIPSYSPTHTIETLHQPLANYFVYDVPGMDKQARLDAIVAALEHKPRKGKEDIVYAAWLVDSRDETITSIQRKAYHICFVDGFAYKRSSINSALRSSTLVRMNTLEHACMRRTL
jgi:hypothetical protein